MEIAIPKDLLYGLDRVWYDLQMVIHQMSFILMQHADDKTDDFLTSDLFQRMHKDLVMTTAQKWCSEVVIIKRILGEVPKEYTINISQGKLIINQ